MVNKAAAMDPAPSGAPQAVACIPVHNPWAALPAKERCRRGPRPGLFYEPTVLAHCTHEMLAMREEIFGPVANASHLGLAAGAVMVNDVLTHGAFAETPLGGLKDSGYGRVQGEEGLRDMCDTVHVNVDRFTFWRSEPFWFPYGGREYREALRVLPVLLGRRGVLSRVGRWL
jgi:succinate-semialdehyde dehydrogenase/glutarate-semialdehyde dehydrogenase